MSKLEKALYELNLAERTAQESGQLARIDPRSKLLVTFLFLICVLSLPLNDLSGLILFFLYPVILCALADIGYAKIFKRSLIILPFLLFIGLFNPILDQQTAFYLGSLRITTGWISFISILARGLLCTQAVYLLILPTGFHNLCKGLRQLGVPTLLTTQLLLVYRYLSILLQEALTMERAAKSRSFGRKSYPVKMWGTFAGQLLIRSIERSERIHRAMLSRGFTGSVEDSFHVHWRKKETLYLAVWSTFLLLVRIFRPADLFTQLFHP